MLSVTRSRISAVWNWVAGRKELAVPTTSRVAAARLTGVLATSASLVGFWLSYHGLLVWSLHHGWQFPYALFFPLLVDWVTAFGELRLFVSASDRDDSTRIRLFWWVVTLAGLATSVAGNVDHGGWNVALDVKAGYSLPSLTAALGLAAGLGLIKKAAARSVTQARAGTAAPAPAPAPAPQGSAVTPGTAPRRPRQPHRASAAGVASGELSRRYTSGSDPSVQAAREAIGPALQRGEKVGGRRKVAEQYKISEWQAGELLRQLTRVNGTEIR